MTPRQQALYERNMKWRAKYEAGATLQQIVDEEEEITYLTTVATAIRKVGGTIRPTGYRKGEKDKNKPKKGLLAWLDS